MLLAILVFAAIYVPYSVAFGLCRCFELVFVIPLVSGLLSKKEEKSINFCFIMVPLRKKY